MPTRLRKQMRFENERGGVLYFRDVVWDGRRVRVDAGSTHLGTGEHHRYEKSGNCFETAEAAAAAFDALVAHQRKSARWATQKPTESLVEADEDRPPLVAENAALEAAVLAGSPGAPGVLADWLQSQGDARGELAALVVAGVDVAGWLTTHGARVFGDLDVKLDSELRGLTFRDGFLDGVSLRRSGMDSTTDLPTMTAAFLAMPVCRFLTSLRFGLASFESDNSWTKTIAAVTASPRAGQIRSLSFDDYTSEDCELSWTPFGDFSEAWDQLPALEHLLVRAGGDGQLGDIALPSLRSFERATGGLATAEFDCILRARWPRLERLTLWLGNADYGGDVPVAQLQRIFDGDVPASLVQLGLTNAQIAPQLIEPLARSKVLPRLRVLDLKMGVLNDGDVDMLLRYAPAFRHLQVFDLSENLFGERLEELQEALPNADLTAQRWEADMEPGPEANRRYTAVGE